jgi:hypothetical protein
MTEEQKAYLRQLEESGYLNQIREFAMARCAPFFWSSQEPGQPPKLLHNGTITYVATGQRELGITNAHVFNHMRRTAPSSQMSKRSSVDQPSTQSSA